MTEAGKGATEKMIGALVRFVAAAGSVEIAGMQDGALLLGGTGQTQRLFGEALLRQASSRGLVERAGRSVRATPQARAYLRRVLLAGGTPDCQGQHRDLEERTMVTESGRETVTVNLAESPLGAIARLKERSGAPFLPAEALAAGERLHGDFTRAHLQPRMTMSYEPRLSAKTKGRAGGAADLTDSALEARARVNRAVTAMGPELSGVALDVCCFQKGLEIVERERQWPVRSAKLILRVALMTLARHYAPPPREARRSHAWGAEGYRPDSNGLGTEDR